MALKQLTPDTVHDLSILTINGQDYPFLESDLRLDPVTSNALGLHQYGVRHDDESGDMCQIKPTIWVNHLMDIVTKTPLPLDATTGGIDIDNEADVYRYTGLRVSVADFLADNYSVSDGPIWIRINQTAKGDDA